MFAWPIPGLSHGKYRRAECPGENPSRLLCAGLLISDMEVTYSTLTDIDSLPGLVNSGVTDNTKVQKYFVDPQGGIALL